MVVSNGPFIRRLVKDKVMVFRQAVLETAVKVPSVNKYTATLGKDRLSKALISSRVTANALLATVSPLDVKIILLDVHSRTVSQILCVVFESFFCYTYLKNNGNHATKMLGFPIFNANWGKVSKKYICILFK